VIAPILRDLPETLETERLLIAPFRPGQGAQVHEAVMESMDNLLPWMPWAKRDYSTAESEEYCRRTYSKFIAREQIPMGLTLKSTGEIVGSSGLHNLKWEVPKFEIGYWCRRQFEGQGYITEAVKAITSFALSSLGAKRLEIRCDARNLRSRRVAERAGYTLEAEMRNECIAIDGFLRTTLVFAKFPE
jgi:RimJ/RimL family protein N-acetyltransferase